MFLLVSGSLLQQILPLLFRDECKAGQLVPTWCYRNRRDAAMSK